MKILFVWDVAGVSCVLAKWLRKRGHKCNVLMRKSHDTFGFLDFYEEHPIDVEGPEFDDVAVRTSGAYDIIHVNSDFRLAARIKAQCPLTKVVLHYHGSDARLNHKNIREPYEAKMDKILVSTVDLYDYVDGAEWLPNPVDTEHFKPTEHRPGALFVKASDSEELPLCPFSYHTIYRSSNPLPYKSMPSYFEGFHMYVDFKNYMDIGLLKPLSKTALEALATGMTVYNSERVIVQGLPNRHNPAHVTDKLLEIYNILNDK
jgi:hypothetical protein